MLPYKNPQGYKQLRTWQQAKEILELTEEFCATFPTKDLRTGQYLTDLKDQMLRSARSVIRNIEEGFVRTTTKEYISFLGFSKGSLEELLRDFEHCIAKGDKGQATKGDDGSRGDVGIGNQEMSEKGFCLCKGESTMLHRQIQALETKMAREKTMSREDMARLALKKQAEHHREANRWLTEVTEKLRAEEKGGEGLKGGDNG